MLAYINKIVGKGSFERIVQPNSCCWCVCLTFLCSLNGNLLAHWQWRRDIVEEVCDVILWKKFVMCDGLYVLRSNIIVWANFLPVFVEVTLSCKFMRRVTKLSETMGVVNHGGLTLSSWITLIAKIMFVCVYIFRYMHKHTERGNCLVPQGLANLIIHIFQSPKAKPNLSLDK